ncbi:Protein-glutamate methylesterase/protein-glutamine glutaminase [Paenibacillus solanacearum]|uniref:Protein-glutamate methylesterase/protein-glutamine glutaminase n=1 Tax=Paenibacillus solanacearum TaxID=2048548 RepID=A0A916JSM4_9BACL|nr:response regulator [Paenibacillus solanacearum]CAG7600376.1 Protein-glutamate methylesterase/protein-glutamine glutaminase [Paenibacillus solanacearum]
MYKVLLADDEKWIVESLKATIHWQSLGFDVVGEAYNGLEAFDRIVELRPDVAFIDIRMPGMNGLELIRRLHSAEVPVHCIVATGYAEFEYAKQAMQYGAVRYCLKPFERTEIEAALEAVKHRIVQSNRLLQLELLNAMYSEAGSEEDSRPAGTAMDDTLSRLMGLRWTEEGGAVAVALQGCGSERIASEIMGSALRVGRDKFVCFVRRQDLAGTKERLSALSAPQLKGIGISLPFATSSSVRERVEAAMAASYSWFTTGEQMAEEADDAVKGEFQPEAAAFRELSEAIAGQDRLRTECAFVRLDSSFREGRCTIRHAFRLYNHTLSLLYAAGNPNIGEEHYVHDYDELVALFGNARAMLDDLRQLTLMDASANTDPLRSLREEERLPQIVDYVSKHFRERLSVQEVSRRFYIHPNYLSHLFKKEMRVNFTKYLTDIRMEHASKLLLGTGLSVGEVAEQSGYDDYFYFAKLFKKHTGLTPSEFRAYGGVRHTAT